MVGVPNNATHYTRRRHLPSLFPTRTHHTLRTHRTRTHCRVPPARAPLLALSRAAHARALRCAAALQTCALRTTSPLTLLTSPFCVHARVPRAAAGQTVGRTVATVRAHRTSLYNVQRHSIVARSNIFRRYRRASLTVLTRVTSDLCIFNFASPCLGHARFCITAGLPPSCLAYAHIAPLHGASALKARSTQA